MQPKKSRAVSLFSGCGGFCEGMELAGFDIRVAVELDKFATETYRLNFPSVPLIEDDVRNFLRPTDKHVERFGLQNVDVVFGGPPCQGFSQIGTRDLNDERNVLYREFSRVVAQLQPRVFVMENVPNILLLNKGHFRDLILKEFESIGYRNTIVVKVSASDFGVPQNRHRVFFIGIRDSDTVEADLAQICEDALEAQRLSEPVTVWEAISDLPKRVVHSGEVCSYPAKGTLSTFQRMMRLDCDREPYRKAIKKGRGISGHPSELHNHHTKEIQERRARLIALLRPGQKADSLPKHIWDGARPEKWRRLHPNQPAYTILAHMHRDLSEWVHPTLNRWITVREAARLQSFHDGFVFASSEWQQLKQIGNAVPPLLAYAMGNVSKAILGQIRTRRRGERHAPRDLLELAAAE
jgi:DNA (cytosine-5)-methyltransferase 1